MKVRARHLLLALLISGILITALRVVQDTVLVEAVAAVFYLVVPGALLLVNFTRVRNLSVGTACVLSVALSVTFIMFSSFLCNAVLPLLGVLHPLATGTVSAGVNALFILLLGVTYWRKGGEALDFTRFRTRLSRLDKVLAGLFAILPVQAVTGALLLNNGSSNGVAIATSVEAVALTAVVFAFRRRLNVAAMYPLALLSASCTVLLMLSVRSPYVLGWDINQELYVLQLAQLHGRWASASFVDSYNTCLSITTLPAALSSLTGISPTGLLKIVYPVLFSFSSLALYELFDHHSPRTWAYLAVIVVIAQPQYMAEMPMLARQEIALLFVAVAYLLLFTHRISNATGDKLLFILLTASIVVSHYSTTYVFMLSLCIMYIWQKLMLRRNRHRAGSPETVRATRSFFSLKLLMACIVIAFAWNVQFAAISTNVQYVARQVYENIGRTLTGDLRSDAILSSIWSFRRVDATATLREYVQAVSAQSGSELAPSYTPRVRIPSSVRGALHSTLGGFKYAYPVLSAFLKICLVFGLVIMLRSRKRDERSLLLQGAVVSYAIGIGVFFILPYVSLAYNFERFVQQALFVLALPILLGLGYFTGLFRRLATSSKAISLTVILVYWLFTLGLSAEVLGGSAPVQYNNYGSYYSYFYARDPEVAALQWIGRTSTPTTPIYADLFAATRFLPYAGIYPTKVNNQMVPPFATNSYIFSSYTNHVHGITFAHIGNRDVSFTFPSLYLEENRNTVYSNGYAVVYR